ncbi:MAG: 6-phosphogluconolactonase [Planctomycetota bacterium]
MTREKPSRKRVVESTEAGADGFVADLLLSVACEATAKRGRCCIALAGGTTPHGLYQRLARGATSEELDWSAVEIFFGDERDVPHDHLESNYGMVQRTMLDHLPIPPDNVHPMRGDATDLYAAAAEYEQTIRERVESGDEGGLPRMDFILLGMGADGHVASLFPDTEATAERERLVTACYVPRLGRNRLTVTFPLINAAHNVALLVTGEDKAETVATLLDENSPHRDPLPAAHVNPTNGRLIMVFDSAAARLANPDSVHSDSD